MISETVTRNVRLGRAGALLAGAVVYALLVYGPLQFYWTPLLLGLAYFGAAAAGGRRGGLWATAVVLTGWGVGVLLATKLDSLSSGDAYLMGIGGAIVVAGVLARRGGFAIDLLSVGGTVLIAGILHNVAGDPVQALVQPWPYVALLAGVGALNLVLALAPRTSPTSSSARTPKQSGGEAAQASPTI